MRRWIGPLIALAALLPTTAALVQGWDVRESRAQFDDVRSARQAVLAKVPSDESVLINVTAREMPASPDLLDLGKRSTRALERCLADNVDANLRAGCAVVLEALADRSALPTLQAALDDWEAPVRYRVVRALATMPDPSSVEPLLELYRRKDEQPYIRSAVLETLGTIADQRVVRALREELEAPGEDGDDFRATAFDALWSLRHLMARTTLVADTRAALGSDNDALVLAATLAAAELRSPQLVDTLVPLMEHGSDEVRNKAVFALGKIGDPKATRALLAKLPDVREARMLNNIAFALERLDKDAFYQAIRDVIGHKQAIIRLNAAFVLGDVRHPDGLPLLVEALKDPSDFVRTSAIVAVGKVDSPASAAAIEPFANDPTLSVREEAIYALHALSEGGRRDLVHDKLFRLSQEHHYDVVHRAALTLGKAGDERAREFLLRCLERFRCGQRELSPLLRSKPEPGASGRVLLAWSRGHGELTGLVGDLRPPGTFTLASGIVESAWADGDGDGSIGAVQVLGRLGDAQAKPLLERRSNAQQMLPRVEALSALAQLGDEAAAARLMSEIENLPAERLPTFSRALERISEPTVRAKLEPELMRRQSHADPHIAMAAAAVRLRWSPDSGVFRFLDAIASPQPLERRLAERYLARNRDERVTWLLRRALAREGREHARDRLRVLLDER